MNTLTRDPGQPPMAKYPSLTSVHSMASIGFLPPGHGYVPKKEKPEKPYGLAFVTVMNRTHRGPGKKYLHYALASGIFALLLFGGAALYFGHRNVSRMVVYRTEVLGALMIIGGILFVAIMGEYLYKARVESNRWRMGIRFRPEGLSTAAAFNEAYVPEDVHGIQIASGTYGAKALREIPKPKAKKHKKARSKDGLDRVGMFERRAAQRPAGPPGNMGATDETQPAYTVEGMPPTGTSTPRYAQDQYQPGGAPVRPDLYPGPPPGAAQQQYRPAPQAAQQQYRPAPQPQLQYRPGPPPPGPQYSLSDVGRGRVPPPSRPQVFMPIGGVPKESESEL